MIDLDVMLQPGKSIRLYYGKGNINNRTMHIRAIVDGDRIVYRVWSKHRQYWVYRVEGPHIFELWNKDGALSDGTKPRPKGANND